MIFIDPVERDEEILNAMQWVTVIGKCSYRAKRINRSKLHQKFLPVSFLFNRSKSFPEVVERRVDICKLTRRESRVFELGRLVTGIAELASLLFVRSKRNTVSWNPLYERTIG